jgi:hypothetical protein
MLMSTEMASQTLVRSDVDERDGDLPTTQCSVVWSGGHSYVLEGTGTRARWAGVDDRGRALFLTDADLRRRGWSRSRR